VPTFEDIPYELKNYAVPRSMSVGVTDRRTGGDTLLVLTGTVILPPHLGRHSPDGRMQRKRIRFVAPQAPKVVTAGSQVRSVQVVAAVASFRHEGPGERTFAIDQSLIEWADDLGELRITVDTACQGVGSIIARVMYNAYVLAQLR
jgi:hypothetical protein